MFMLTMLSCVIRRDHDEWHDVAVEDLKPKLSCGASFEFQELKTWKRSFRARLPSNSTLLNSNPLYSTQLNSALLNSTLLNSTQLDLKIS